LPIRNMVWTTKDLLGLAENRRQQFDHRLSLFRANRTAPRACVAAVCYVSVVILRSMIWPH
jgi:hypothetical protein